MTPLVSDLSGPKPADPLAQIAAGNAVSDAQRGFDIARLVRVSWLVCKLCDRPTRMDGGRSRCCAAPVRMQGWAAPAVGAS